MTAFRTRRACAPTIVPVSGLLRVDDRMKKIAQRRAASAERLWARIFPNFVGFAGDSLRLSKSLFGQSTIAIVMPRIFQLVASQARGIEQRNPAVAIKTWSSVSENAGTILGINAESVFVLTVKAATKGEIEPIEKRIGAGADPNAVGASRAVIIPFAKLRRIQLGEGRRMLEFFYPHETDGSRESKAKFPTKVRFRERREIAEQIASATGRPVTESSVNASLLRVLYGPALFAALTAGFTWMIYGMAADLEAGKEVVARGRRKGIQQLFIWLAGLLGTKVTLAIGVVFIALWVGLAILLIVKRPQVIRLEFETAAG
jgi:hypothetical protein